MSKNKFALGAILGAVAGMVAGILTAPKSGKETRGDLKTKADELKEKATVASEDLMQKAEGVKKQVEDTINKVKK